LVARKATGRFDDQLGETNLDAQILNLGSVKNIDRPDFYTMLTNKIFGDKSNLDKFSKRDSMIIASSNAGGEYARSIHALHVDPGQLSTLRHENTHALGAMYQKDKIHDIIQ